MPKLKIDTKNNGDLSVKFGPAQALVDDGSFDFKFKGFKAEGDVVTTQDGFQVDGTLKLRGTQIEFDGMFTADAPTYSFDGQVGGVDVAVAVTLQPSFNFDLNV